MTLLEVCHQIDREGERKRLEADTLAALRQARYSLFAEGGTDSPFEAELDRLITLYETA